MSLAEWTAHIERCWESKITLNYATGTMTVDFLTFLKEHNYTVGPVRHLLRMADAQNKAIMLNTVRTAIYDCTAEHAQLKTWLQVELQKVAVETDIKKKEHIKKAVERRYATRCKQINARRLKLEKLQSVIIIYK